MIEQLNSIERASHAIKEIKAMGMCDGVTTNPSLMAKEGRTDTDALFLPMSNQCIDVLWP